MMAEPRGLAKVLVQISATERVSYSKVVEIPAEALAEYDAAVERDERDLWFSEWADRFLDPMNDIMDAGEYEDVECDPVKPDVAERSIDPTRGRGDE